MFFIVLDPPFSLILLILYVCLCRFKLEEQLKSEKEVFYTLKVEKEGGSGEGIRLVQVRQF